MNILTFDIEEWYIEKKFNGARSEKYQEFDRYLKMILNLLDEAKTTATFFCLGKIATDFPEVIKIIAEKGHEIGCHSDEHIWLTKMTSDTLRKDTHRALFALQDISGKKVVSYRAPAFSIGENNKWAIEILAEEGIECDSSIFPAKRDFGGFENFPTASPTIVKYNNSAVKEFPICMTRVLNYKVAYSGGGYFRFFPYSFVKKNMSKSDYAIAYFHIGDLLHNSHGIMSKSEYEEYFKEAGTLKNRIMRYVKSSIGTKTAFDKMTMLIKNMEYVPLSQANAMTDWASVECVDL